MILNSNKIKTDWEFFSPHELKCKCGACDSVGYEMNPWFMEKAVNVRRRFDRPMIVTSAIRCALYNASLTQKSNGEHVQGEALDILASGSDAYDLIMLCKEEGFTRFGLKQHDMFETRFIHIGGAVNNPHFISNVFWTYP